MNAGPRFIKAAEESAASFNPRAGEIPLSQLQNSMSESKSESKFPLGNTVITRNAKARLTTFDILEALKRHHRGDWGDVGDRQENEKSLAEGGRLLSVYYSGDGLKFWIITEWDRSATTILMPEDY
jgi:hypothetical protein